MSAKLSAYSGRLLQALFQATPDENLFCSPASLAFALFLAMDGAEGETRAEIARVLGVDDLPPDELNRLITNLMQLLSGSRDGVTLHIANSLWTNPSLPLNPDFVSRAKKNLAATVQPISTAEATNNWCAEQTEGKIPEIINEISPDAALLILNAIYFKGLWQRPFNEEYTSNQPFHLPDGSVQQVQMMHRIIEKVPYFNTKTCQAIRLAYRIGEEDTEEDVFEESDDVGMYIFLPHEGFNVYTQIEDLNNSLDRAEKEQVLFNQFESDRVFLLLPRFKFEWGCELNDILKSLGINQAFIESQARFGSLFLEPPPPEQNVYIDTIRQKCFVEVNEKGTEAGVVTVNEWTYISVEPPEYMHVNRPFIILIRDDRTQTILFAGAILNPIGERVCTPSDWLQYKHVDDVDGEGYLARENATQLLFDFLKVIVDKPFTDETKASLLRILEDGADINALREDRHETCVDEHVQFVSPLCWAASKGNSALCDLLIKQGAHVNEDKEGFASPLIAAIESHEISVIKTLLTHGVDVNFTGDIYERTPLSLAVDYTSFGNGLDLIELFIEHGAKIDAWCVIGVRGQTAEKFRGPALSHAAWLGNSVVCEFLINHGANVNAKGEHGETALMHACLATMRNGVNQLDVCRLLINYGADLNAHSNYGETPLMCAASNGYREIIQFLIANGADVTACDNKGRSAMDVLRCDDYMTRAIIEDALRAQNVEMVGRTRLLDLALISATAAGDLERVKVLVEQEGADINAEDAEGRSASSLAYSRRHIAIEEYFTKREGDNNKLLFIYCRTDNVKGVQELIDGGIDLEITEPLTHCTPLASAVRYNAINVIPLLLNAGADPKSRGKSGLGDTAEELAIRKNNPAVIEILGITPPPPKKTRTIIKHVDEDGNEYDPADDDDYECL